MKRSKTCSTEVVSSSDDSSSSSESDSDSASKVKLGKRKIGAVDFEALSRHGYKGGLSVLRVPPPKEDHKQDWTWSGGKESGCDKETDESYEERQRTRQVLNEGEELIHVQTRREKEEQKEKDRERREKNLSFAQKEKRKRDIGQASRGKSYVEEEKRLLRDNGVYSGI